MEYRPASNEFNALIDDDGRITVPSELAKKFAGRKLHVRLHKEEISSGLQERAVTEDEIERIERVQRDSREQIVKFLLSEGLLKKDAAFVQRAQGLKR